jgi:cytochrome c oxidase assembly factor CtaG
VLTFAAGPIYPVYAATAAAAGVDPLRDQQLAGLLMWIPGGLVYLGAACAAFVSWLRRVDADQRRSEGGAEREVVRA